MMIVMPVATGAVTIATPIAIAMLMGGRQSTLSQVCTNDVNILESAVRCSAM